MIIRDIEMKRPDVVFRYEIWLQLN